MNLQEQVNQLAEMVKQHQEQLSILMGQHAESEYVTREEAAKIMGVHPNTIANWRRDRILPYRKVGRAVRICRSALTSKPI